MTEIHRTVFVISYDEEFKTELIKGLRIMFSKRQGWESASVQDYKADAVTAPNPKDNDIVLADVSLNENHEFPCLKDVIKLRDNRFKGGIVFITFDDEQWLLELNDKKMQYPFGEEHIKGKMLGVLRCPNAAQSRVKAPFKLRDFLHAVEESLKNRVENLNCLAGCGSWFPDDSQKCILSEELKWRYMIIDDMIVEEKDISEENPVSEEFFLKTKEGTEFCELVKEIYKVFGGTLLLRSTQFLCELMKNEIGKGDTWETIKDAESRMEKLDFILLDIIFDQEVSMDIKIIPLIRSFSDVPIFMLTSASERGHATEKLGRFYYPVRTLRLGAQGYFDKAELVRDSEVDTDRIKSIKEEIESYLLNRHWEREYHERFIEINEGKNGFIKDPSGLFKACCKDDEKKKEHYHYILRKLFDGYDYVRILARPSHGVGSADKFFVRPFKGGTPYNVKLVKIGPSCDLQFEKKNFDEVVDGYIDSYIGRVKGDRIATDLYSGIMYTAVGYKDEYEKGPEHYPKTLYDFIMKHIHSSEGSKKIQKALNFLFDRILSGLYSDRDRKETYILKEYYNILPPLATFKHIDTQLHQESKPFCVNAITKSTFEELNENEPVLLKGHISKWKTSGKDEAKLEIMDPPSRKKVTVKANTEILRDARLRYGKEIEIQVRKESNSWIVNALRTEWNEAVGAMVSGEPKAPHGEEKRRERLERLRYQELTKREFDMGEIISSDPFNVLETLLTKPGLGIPMTISTAHGDLNLGNVLVSDIEMESEDRRAFWLIDFAYTQRERHLGFDFVKLETEIKTHIISRILLDYWLEQEMRTGISYTREKVQKRVLQTYKIFEEKLMGYSLNGGRNTEVEDEEFYKYTPLRNLFDTICFIRKKALNLDVTAEEYFFSLFLYSLTTMKFGNLKDPDQHPAAPFPKIVAYIAAAVLSERIKEELK